MGIGRRPAKKVLIPHNRTMHAKADKILERVAVAKAEHYTESLKVDAPWFYFWYKQGGTIPCSCTAKRSGLNANVLPGQPNETSFAEIGDDASIDIDFAGGSEYRDADELNTPPEEQSLADFINSLNSSSGPKKAPMVVPQHVEEKVLNEDYDDDDGLDEIMEVEDVSNALTGAQTDFKDPFNLFSDKTIQCPICLDAGFIDSWNVHGGQRFVFDTSAYHGFQCDKVNVDDTKNPTVLEGLEYGRAFWTFKLPYLWLDIARAQVYNGEVPLPNHQYTWRWVNADDEDESGPVTRESLNTLNNSGKRIRLVITCLEDVSFTHAEVIFAYRNPYKAQLPEIPQGYEQEFLDWNTTISVELPPSLKIQEGCYLTESKYSKVWKVNVVTRKATAGGTVFGLAADLRALHPFEKKYMQFSLFRPMRINENETGPMPTGGYIDVDNFNWSEVEW